MGQDKNQLTKLLVFVKDLYDNPDNKEFAAGIEHIVLNRLAISTNEKIGKIKDALEIRADSSIDYSFVKDIYIQRQLMIDNLRMENVLLNLSMSEKERYENFCISAFLQVENILNYYYCERFDRDLNAILANIEDATQFDNYPFRRVDGKTYYYVSEIAIASKIQAFCKQFFPYNPSVKDFTLTNLHKLRSLRNDIFHRAGENNNVSQNAANAERPTPSPTANMFRDTLKRLVKKVKEQLNVAI